MNTINTITASLLLASAAQAATFNTALNLPAAGNYSASGVSSVVTVSTTTSVSTSQNFNGATFDIVYTLGSLSDGANPFVGSNGTILGVGSDTDTDTHYTTLEGNDNEGISFTNLSITNFQDNGSGVVIGDITNLSFTSFTLNAVGNLRDSVSVSFTSFADLSPESVSSIGSGNAVQTISLTGLSNYPASATDMYLEPNNNFSSNRWNVSGIGVTYTAVPEPSSYALLAGIIGLAIVMVRRRK